jgi:hypothetical protein
LSSHLDLLLLIDYLGSSWLTLVSDTSVLWFQLVQHSSITPLVAYRQLSSSLLIIFVLLRSRFRTFWPSLGVLFIVDWFGSLALMKKYLLRLASQPYRSYLVQIHELYFILTMEFLKSQRHLVIG